jgi:choline-glycine betaine transporter
LFLFLALIIVFMATSGDTSTLVVSTLAMRRAQAPSTGHIVFWGVFQGVVAISVLTLGGAETLQVLAVLTGAPFAVLSVLAMVGLLVTWYRTEEGHTSLVRRVIDRLPRIEQHHDIDPPDDRE